MGSINALAGRHASATSVVQATQDKMAQSLNDQARENEEFCALMIEFGRQQVGFDLAIRSRQEELKSTSEIVRDSIRKGAEH